MTTLGKILVIINFLFSLITGWLIVTVFAVSTNWEESYRKLKGYYNVSEANVRTYAEEAQTTKMKAEESIKNIKNDYDRLAQERAKLEEKNKELADSIEKERLATKLAVASATAATEELGRRREELKLEQTKVAARDKRLIELEGRSKEVLDKYVRADIAYRSLKDRVVQLTQTMESMSAQLERYKAGSSSVRGQVERRPPPEDVEGIVTETDAKSGLVTISIGSDAGLNKGNSLYVYRLSPEPKYLGEIRILDVNHHEAVGRPVTGQRAFPLQKGDRVASNIGGQR